MCAIAGILRRPPSNDIIKNMLSTMRRRGPDAQDVFIEKDVCLLHSRLVVIDPEGGAQPMTLNVAGNQFTIVYNGELYNTGELRRQLQNLGHNFNSHSDTEVVLRAFIQWGEESLQVFNGIFGFAIWDHQRERLFLARDKMGVKPLFYTHQNGMLIFASEIKTILAHPEIKACIDAEGIAQILCLGPGRIPGSGVFHNIMELKPGHCGYFYSNKLELKEYWKLTDREHRESFSDTVDHVRYLVTDAIQRQMISDVPLGTFLSGGLDSSLISAVCAKAYKNRGEQLQTFSVDYKNNHIYFLPGKFQPNSDSQYIDIMRDYIGSNHRTTEIDPRDLASVLEHATIARDLPGMADVDASLLLFCKEIRKHVTVALSGECADEIFGGYPWYRDAEIRATDGFPWAQNAAQRASLLSNEIPINPYEMIQDLYHDTIRQVDILPGTEAVDRRMKEMVVLNQNWFMQTLLDRKDRMSMFSSLEVRVPFCDYRIAEYLYGVPWKYKDYQGREKGLLRMAVSDLLPNDIVWRKKSPYPKTFDPTYLECVRKQLNDVIEKKSEPIHQIVNMNALNTLISQESQWPWYGQLMKLPQTIAYMLQINQWLKHFKIEIL